MTDSVSTPAYIVNSLKREFKVDAFYDPCPFNQSFDPAKHKDGLTTEWGEYTFCNPPYSNPKPWFKKAHEQWLQGKTVILFAKLSFLGRKYAKRYVPGAEIRIFSYKVKFPGYGNGNPRFTNVLIIWHKDKISNKYSLVEKCEDVLR